MQFYIRKSISAGPFRFNFSKGGVGVSVGVRGLRIGTGPRGHYIHAGIGGLYYRASLGKAGKPKVSASRPQHVPQISLEQDDVAMVEVDSGDVMLMRDETFDELLDEINSKSRQVRMSSALFWTPSVVGAIAGALSGGPGLLLVALALPGWALGRWLDSYRRSTVLYYDLEGDAEAAYSKVAEGFDGLMQCAGKWHIEAGGAVTNLTVWKRNAGASHLVRRKPTSLAYELPSFIKSNISPPALSVGKQVMYFMPDVVLVKDGGRVGAVDYRDLHVWWQDSRFIEDGRVPSDATIVGHTWKHPNKSGGPDRRFRDNKQIPICLYETIHFQSNSGVNELVEFSRTGRAADFANGCKLIAQLPEERKQSLPAAIPTQIVAEVEEHLQPAKKKRWFRNTAFAALAILVGLPLLGLLVGVYQRSTPTPQGRAEEATSASPATSVAQEIPCNVTSILPAVVPDSVADRTISPPEGTARLPTDVSGQSILASTSVSSTLAEDTVPRAAWHTRTAVNLRKGPGTAFPIVSVIESGSQVTVLEQQRSWSRVKLSSGVTGWVMSKAIVEDK